MPISVKQGSNTTTYEYDALGRLTKETENGIVKTYSMDKVGNITASNVGEHWGRGTLGRGTLGRGTLGRGTLGREPWGRGTLGTHCEHWGRIANIGDVPVFAHFN